MMRNGLFALALSVALFPICLPASAHGADSCQLVFDALLRIATTPSHSYTTSTPVNGGKPMDGETIFANGQKYMRGRGKWMHLPVTSQDVIEQEKEKQEHGKSSCQLLRPDAVNGEPASVYSMHREYEEVTEDGQVWISKRSGLPLRVDADVDNTGNRVKAHSSTRFEYGNIQPPM